MGVLGGSIGAVSNPDHGSIFWIAFPIEEALPELQTNTPGQSWAAPHVNRVTSARQQRNAFQENARKSVEMYVSNAQPGPPPTPQCSSAESASGPRPAASLSTVQRSSSQSVEGLSEEARAGAGKLSSQSLAELAKVGAPSPWKGFQLEGEGARTPQEVAPDSMEVRSTTSALSSLRAQPDAAVAAVAVAAASTSSLFQPTRTASLRTFPPPPPKPPTPPPAASQGVPLVSGHPYTWPMMSWQHPCFAVGMPLPMPPPEHSVSGSALAAPLGSPWAPHAPAAPAPTVQLCYYPMPALCPPPTEPSDASSGYCQPQTQMRLTTSPQPHPRPHPWPPPSTTSPAVSERRCTDAAAPASAQQPAAADPAQRPRNSPPPADLRQFGAFPNAATCACLSYPGVAPEGCVHFVSASSTGVSSASCSGAGTVARSAPPDSTTPSEAPSASTHRAAPHDPGKSASPPARVDSPHPGDLPHDRPEARVDARGSMDWPPARDNSAPWAKPSSPGDWPGQIPTRDPPRQPSHVTLITSSLRSRSSVFGGSEVAISARSQGSRRTVSALSLCDDSLPTESDLSGISGVKVLLAEDNLINQLVAKKMLAALGVKVTVVSNGRDAVDAVLGKGAMGFDVILMDMAMPVLDGVAAAVELRQLGFTLPIVAMTANLSERDQELCRDAGMNGFLSKPILKGRLGRSLKQVLTWGTLFADGPHPEKAAWQGAVQEGGAEGSGVGLRPEFQSQQGGSP